MLHAWRRRIVYYIVGYRSAGGEKVALLCATCLAEEDSLLYGGLQVCWRRVVGFTMCYMPGGGG